MRTLAFLLIVATSAIGGDKNKNEPPKLYDKDQLIQAPCEKLWPVALQVFMRSGFAVKTSDKSGGIITLEWTRGETRGAFRFINPLVREFTMAKSTGFWTQYTGFRIAGASAILAPEGGACRCTIQVTYHGFERRSQGENWWVLESNGFREVQLLDEIDATVQKAKPTTP